MAAESPVALTWRNALEDTLRRVAVNGIAGMFRPTDEERPKGKTPDEIYAMIAGDAATSLETRIRNLDDALVDLIDLLKLDSYEVDGSDDDSDDLHDHFLDQGVLSATTISIVVVLYRKIRQGLKEARTQERAIRKAKRRGEPLADPQPVKKYKLNTGVPLIPKPK
jgi:hypothetical protein